MGSQVSGIDRSQFPGGRTVGEVRRGGSKEGEPAIEQRREYTVLGFDLGERKEQVVCHASALATTDEAH